MKWRGLELKMPNLKMPEPLVDLFYDLRDRRLLPLIALALVAIVAVPFLLGDDSVRPARGPLVGGPAVGSGGGGEQRAVKLTVVRANPGLRDYRKRLRRRTPTNPFKQRYAGEVKKGATSTSRTSAQGTSTSSGPTTSGPGAGGAAPSPQAGSGVVFFAFAVNVRIVKVPGPGPEGQPTSEPQTIVKKEVLPQTPLPSEEEPVITFLGLSRKKSMGGGERVLLLVSDQVRSTFGEGRCAAGDETCQLLEVEPGMLEEFIYGEEEAVYRVNVLKIVPVITGRTTRAQNFSK